MATINTLLDLARNSLANDQFALETTANNVANQNTVGYTRQVVNWSSGDRVTLGGHVIEISPGVTSASQRDRVLEQRLQQGTQTQTGLEAQSSVLSQVENVFTLSSTKSSAFSTPIGTSLDSLFASLTTLSSAPADSATRQGVLNAANTLASTLNSAAQQLLGINQDVNGQVATNVAQVNTLTQTIAKLNLEITSESPNRDGGTLEDQRQSAITSLSKLIGLNQITTESNGIALTTTGGATLVSGSKAFNLTAVTVSGATQLHDSNGVVITAGTQGGAIGGLLAAQNTNIPAAQSSLDALAFNLATAINTQNAAGLTAAGLPGAPIFNLPGSASGAAASISVAATSISDVAAAAPGEGSSGNTNARLLAALGQSVGANGLTFAGTYGSLLSQVGSTASAVSLQSANQQTLVTQLQSQRDSYSSVSLDEEAANLAQYQRSYQAAAKLFSVVDTIFTSALNLGQQTTVA